VTTTTPLDCGSPPTDEQLLARHAQGQRQALDELFRRHWPAAYRVAYQYLGQDADALDAVQQGFVKAFRHLGGFRHQSSFRTWLMRIIANTATDLRRERQRRRMVALDQTWLRQHESLQPALSQDPALPLEAADLRRHLDEAVAALPEAHRRPFVLRVKRGLTYARIAKVMGIPIGTVMSRLHHARRKLQSLLAHWPEAQGGGAGAAG
jgi:RNA polymerase sigma-70 factor (ECF subfamily)